MISSNKETDDAVSDYNASNCRMRFFRNDDEKRLFTAGTLSGKPNATTGPLSFGAQGGVVTMSELTKVKKTTTRKGLCCWILLLSVVSTALLSSWNAYYEMQQSLTPLDTLLTAIKIPMTRCPAIPSALASSSISPSNITVHMLTGRPPSQVKEVVDSWTKAGFHVKPYSTIGMEVVSHKHNCLRDTWDTRLFSLYQQFFRYLLESESATTHFLTIEDDTVLEDAAGLLLEWEWAKETKHLDYYSFYATPCGCAYLYGAQAQLVSRRMMERTVDVDKSIFCRLPIDRWFSLSGSYWSTSKTLVRHEGVRSNTNSTTQTQELIRPNMFESFSLNFGCR